MTTKTPISGVDTEQPTVTFLLSNMETEQGKLCSLIDALSFIVDHLPGIDGTETPFERRAFNALSPMLDLLSERAELIFETCAQANLMRQRGCR